MVESKFTRRETGEYHGHLPHSQENFEYVSSLRLPVPPQMDNITKLASDTPEGVIPQRPYSIAWGPIDVQLGNISFMTTTGEYIPAQHALRGDCVCLLDKDGAAFGGSVQTISIRIQVLTCFYPLITYHLIPMPQWPGYDGWARQVRILFHQSAG